MDVAARAPLPPRGPAPRPSSAAGRSRLPPALRLALLSLRAAPWAALRVPSQDLHFKLDSVTCSWYDPGEAA